MTDPVCVRKAPFPVPVKAGTTVWWCACGRSADQPFCDGSHAGTGQEPVAYTATGDRTVWFCGCKATRQPPLCDGSHKTL
jgi:CDGSH-type Zn-finger protein